MIGLVCGLVVLALVGGGVSWYVLTLPKPEETATPYVEAWNSGDYAAMAALATGADVEESYTRVSENLGIEQISVEAGTLTEGDDTATLPFTAHLTLRNAGEWSYEGEIPLVYVDGDWKVDFSPAVIHPDLGDDQTLVRTNEWGERGHILAADGTRLDTDQASGSIKMLTGEVGTATAEDLEELGPAYAEGDPTGKGGIQQSYEERLAGKATTTIKVAEIGQDDSDGGEETVLASLGGEDGQDVTTSIDPAVQSAAAQAIIDQDKPTALVAVRPSTGEILAAANVPGGYNRAIEGQYPPGSAFKIISYEALLDSGLSSTDTMECPKTAEVGGWPFKNAGDAEYGTQSVTEAFATSCNTALVQEVAERLDAQSLTAAAEEFGMNSEMSIGIPSLTPSFPTPDSTTLLAASSIGQGQILTSPLHMATVPAAVADGSWRSPVLVTDPAIPDRPEPHPIGNAEALRTMMRAVITEGTAEDAGFTGEVYGKTGSAEFGTAEEGEELETHAWFVGYEGDLAFAVVVEGGGGGGSVAAPIGADFLGAL
ncbi:penicillin-binding transpeptidase domain-containing protein [Marinactinospora thermotolerans]|uniref:Cell division protein FtsI/penicillin-binding protein 2 n=1 Tax=Marinactinospora thermotolerans DSM 45154 TaxID=1122192 RepID=A0A1T4K986_9ACTN|nr:Cell division protein FtsI/penicillin-binding protein 2 [Marinactinospora thermotolerans DSM 45154]